MSAGRTAKTGRSPSSLFLVPLAICLLCSCQSPLSQIVLDVDSDLVTPAEVDTVALTVAGATQAVTLPDVTLTGSAPGAFPLTLGLSPAGALSPVLVTVVGRLSTNDVVRQQIRTEFVDGKSLLLRMLLLSACSQFACADGQTCIDGACADSHLPGASLPVWTGKVPDRPPPHDPVTPIGGRSVWAAGGRTCAIDGHTLYCWGQNTDGQLGIGTVQNAATRRAVSTPQDPSAIGLGSAHSCACDPTGQAFCWGRNIDGEVGTGNTTAASRPVAVVGLTDCQQIAGGAQHTCVLRHDSTLSCWGNNAKGQLALPPSTTPVTSPHAVAGLTDILEVGTGDRSTCVRLKDASVWCWGDNSSGQLGDGTTKDHSAPAQVVGLPADIVELGVSPLFACARRMTGQLWCWGDNASGQLGNGTRTGSSTPVEVTGVSDATQIAAGGSQHICIVRRSGVASCWGSNAYGQFGDGTLTSSLAPVDVSDIKGVVSLTAGSTHTCARHFGGLGCWGQNNLGQLGDGTTMNRSTPILVAGFPSSYP